jgi:hypothetical protein
MSSSLQHGPTSFRTRFARGRLRFGDVLAIVLAGTGFCALALFGLAAVLTEDPPVRASLRAPVAAASDFTVRDLGTYVGNWVSERGTHLIVTKSGAVWADAGGLVGSARLDGRDRTRLIFEGSAFRCTYRIAAEQPDALVWSVEDGTPGTACPQGRYSRRFTF